jgi:hypothetical protein
MLILAESFAGLGEMILLVCVWSVALLLALVALALAFWRRTRIASQWLAGACMVCSVAVFFTLLSLQSTACEPGPVSKWPAWMIGMGPLVLSVAVFCFDTQKLKGDRN